MITSHDTDTCDMPGNHPTSLLVVIVCYRAAQLTIECLRSLASEISSIPNARVIVCENGTGPDSVAELRQAIESNGWDGWVTLRIISPNRGFSGGNNVVLRESLNWKHPPAQVLLLNADTLVRPGALEILMRATENHPEVGVFGPRLEWPDGEAQISCFHYLNPISEMLAAACTGPLTKIFKKWSVPIPVRDTPFEPEWLSFACALLRREVLDEVGVLDDGYFLYFDDVDYCRRAWRAGWHVRYCPEAHVVHLRGQSNPVKTLTAERKRRPQYFYRSRSRYFAKFYGRFGLWLTNGLWHLGRSLSLLREWFGSKQPHLCEHESRDIWSNGMKPMHYDHDLEWSRSETGEPI